MGRTWAGMEGELGAVGEGRVAGTRSSAVDPRDCVRQSLNPCRSLPSNEPAERKEAAASPTCGVQKRRFGWGWYPD
jgi:hypothetical protein